MPAPRIVFMPGVGADPEFWKPVGDRLPAAWDKVYLGWPGLGDQPSDPSVSGWDDLLRLTLEAVGPGTADLVAQSMGGFLALAATLRHPRRVRRLVLTATSGGIDVGSLGAAEWRATHRAARPNAPAWIYQQLPDLAPRIGDIRSPTLLIWGDQDPLSPVAVGRRLADLLPSAALRIVVGGDHALALARAAEIAPWIEAHLA